MQSNNTDHLKLHDCHTTNPNQQLLRILPEDEKHESTIIISVAGVRDELLYMAVAKLKSDITYKSCLKSDIKDDAKYYATRAEGGREREEEIERDNERETEERQKERDRGKHK